MLKMLKNSIIALIATLICSALYRFGGWGSPFNTKYRDFGVPLISHLYLLYLGYAITLWFGAALILAVMAMTTYNKWFQALFGYPDDDVYWPAWAMTGFVYGLTALPLAYQTGKWVGFFIRTIFLTIATCLWSEKISDVNWEEGGRGFLFTITLPLLLI